MWTQKRRTPRCFLRPFLWILLRQYRTIRWQRRRCLFRHLLLADFFDLPPVNLQNLPLHLTKNSFASAPTHLCGIALWILLNLRRENLQASFGLLPDTPLLYAGKRVYLFCKCCLRARARKGVAGRLPDASGRISFVQSTIRAPGIHSPRRRMKERRT